MVSKPCGKASIWFFKILPWLALKALSVEKERRSFTTSVDSILSASETLRLLTLLIS